MSARPIREADRCPCGGSLFTGWFDAEGFAVGLPPLDAPDAQVPEGVRYTTFCNDCGDEVDS